MHNKYGVSMYVGRVDKPRAWVRERLSGLILDPEYAEFLTCINDRRLEHSVQKGDFLPSYAQDLVARETGLNPNHFFACAVFKHEIDDVPQRKELRTYSTDTDKQPFVGAVYMRKCDADKLLATSGLRDDLHRSCMDYMQLDLRAFNAWMNNIYYGYSVAVTDLRTGDLMGSHNGERYEVLDEAKRSAAVELTRIFRRLNDLN